MTEQPNKKKKRKMSYKEWEAEKQRRKQAAIKGNQPSQSKKKSVSGVQKKNNPNEQKEIELTAQEVELMVKILHSYQNFKYCWFCRTDVFAIPSWNGYLECPNCTNTTLG